MGQKPHFNGLYIKAAYQRTDIPADNDCLGLTPPAFIQQDR